MPRCTICEIDKHSVDSLKLHLKLFHKDYNDLFTCKEDDCYRIFKGWKEFRKHLITVHKSVIFAQDIAESNVNLSIAGPSNAVDTHFSEAVSLKDGSIERKSNAPLTNAAISEIENLVESLAVNYTSKLYSNPRLSRDHVQHAVEDVSGLIENILTTIKPHLNTQEDQLNKIKDAVMKPFQTTLSTEYRRLRVIENTQKYIKPRDYVVGDRLDNILHEGRIIQDRTTVTAKFIPMREVLKEFISMPGVLEKIDEYLKYLEAEKEKGIYSNFVQCELWQEKLKTFGDKFVLPLFVYYDDFEINNPLGSHAGVNRIGAVYFFDTVSSTRISCKS